MGIVANSIVFEGPLPDLTEIVERVTGIAGQPVAMIEPEADEELDLYDLNVTLELAGARKTRITVKVYRPGSVREYCEGTDFPMPEAVDGYGETGAVRTVYLRGYLGQELALFHLTLLALESLGGRRAHPIADDVRRRYGEPISDSEAARWRREPKAASVLGALLWVLLVPWLILSGCVTVLMLLPALPRMLWKAVRADRGGGSR